MLAVKYRTIFYQFYCGHEPTWVRNIVSCVPGDWLQVKNTVPKPDRHLFGHANANFSVCFTVSRINF